MLYETAVQEAEVYKAFVNIVCFPENCIKGMYDTNLVRYIFSAQEIDIFTSKCRKENVC